MYATLGNIQFEVLTGPFAMDSSGTAEYAEHKLIEGKPRLQFMGEGLDTISLQANLHSQFCNPEQKLNELRAAKAGHQAMALVLGNGLYRGRFVISDLAETLRQTTSRGDIISLEVRLTLKEWVDVSPLVIKQQQQLAQAQGRKKPGARGLTYNSKKASARPTLMSKTVQQYGSPDKTKVAYKTIVRQG